MNKQVKKRSEIEEPYKWDLTDLIASQEALEILIGEIREAVSRYASYRGTLADSPKALAEYLAFDDSVSLKLSKLSAYASQRNDEDVSVSKYQALLAMAGALSSRAAEASAYAEPEILAVPGDTMAAFLESEELSLYKRKLERILAKKEHMLSEAEERILASAEDALSAPSVIFKRFNNADLVFPDIRDGNGETLPVSHGRYGSLMEHADRNVRREAFSAYYEPYIQFGNTAAAMFEGNVKQACLVAGVRNYASSRAYYLAENEIPERVYDNLLSVVGERIGLLHRYIAIKKKLLGLDRVHMYDLYAPVPGMTEKTYSYKEAQELILTALAPLGEEYTRILKHGFESRWIDVYENQGKRSGAYSNSVYGVHPYVLMQFDGTFQSVITLAHEMGHALHSWYSSHNQPYPYARYKIFVAEVASTCNEVLLLQYMMDHASGEEERTYLALQLMERFRTVLFRQAMFAEFEWKAHQLAWEDTPLTKELLCGIYHELNVKYFGPQAVVDAKIDYEWERIPHFYRPFYVYQYATGFSAATAIAGRVYAEHGREQGALEGYFRFLKGGCSQTPVGLLRLCGVDMETPRAVNEALDLFERLIKEREQSL